MNKTKISRIAAIAILSLLLIAAAMSLAAATGPTATTGNVWTQAVASPRDSTSEVQTFGVGQTVYIFWNSEIAGTFPLTSGTVVITVVDLDTNTVVFGPTAQLSYNLATPSAQTPVTWVPAANGNYAVELNGKFIVPIEVASVFVFPEYAIGALAAVGAGLAAFGTVRIVRRKKD
jgi:hypothetical protein